MRRARILAAIAGLLMMNSCEKGQIIEPEIRIEQNKDLASRINTQKPVKISLKRKPNGTYSWDISGNDVDSILKADKKLREEFETK